MLTLNRGIGKNVEGSSLCLNLVCHRRITVMQQDDPICFNIYKRTPHFAPKIYLWILHVSKNKTVIIFLSTTKQLVFVMEMQWIFCMVGTEFLIII
jgi:hypothetical protein